MCLSITVTVPFTDSYAFLKGNRVAVLRRREGCNTADHRATQTIKWRHPQGYQSLVRLSPIFQSSKYSIFCSPQGRHAQDCGLNLSQIAYLYVGFGVASVIGRLLSGKTGDIKYLDPCHLLFLTAILAGVSTILCPFARTFTNLLVYFCANGICDGFHATLTIVIILRNTSAEQATKWTSIFLFIISFGFAFGPPFGGKIL